MKIALAGNPNSGKTTMYNALTGKSEKVGNWAGVTVESKESPLKRSFYKGKEEVIIVDLPGAYSMSPFTSEESITSLYVKNENPDVIINIVDATNLSRSLFFTTQLLELGIPVVVALNKTDVNDKKDTHINVEKLSKALRCPVVETTSTISKGLDKLINVAISLKGEKQIAPYVQKEIDLENKEAVEEEDRERFKFVNNIVTLVETRKVLTKNKNFQDKIDAILTNKWLGIPIFAVVMFLVFWISQAGPGAWIAEGIEFSNGTYIPGLVGLLEMFQEWVAGLIENAHPVLQTILIDGILGGFIAVVGFLPLVMVMYFLIALLEDCGYMSRVSVVLDPIFKKVGLSGKSIIPFVIGTGCAIPGVMACRTIRNEKERRTTAMLTPFMPCGAKLPVIALFAGAFFSNSLWITPVMYFVGIAIIFLGALLINVLTNAKKKKSYFIIELPEYKAPSFVAAVKSMCQRGWAYIVKAGTIILVCNFIVQLLLTFTFSFQVLDYDTIIEDGTSSITEQYLQNYAYKNKDGYYVTLDEEGNEVIIEDEEEYMNAISYMPELNEETNEIENKVYTVYDHPLLIDEWEEVNNNVKEEASKSMLAKISAPFAYLFAPITLDVENWQLSAAAITGFIAKENVVGTLTVCYGAVNKINADFEIIGNGANTLAAVIGISQVVALAYLMLNLFTPPCFAAIGAMNSEIKSRKWFFGGIGLQFGVGYSIAFLVSFFGSLFTKASLGLVWMPILGWGIVLLFVGILTVLSIKNRKQLN